jgi:putative transposase
MYRILDANAEVRERRNQPRHSAYSKPELLAEGPNQVWSWDIIPTAIKNDRRHGSLFSAPPPANPARDTMLKGPAKWSYFYLYVIIDIFSRRVVAWCVVDAENAALS